jgi:hypothetical protein
VKGRWSKESRSGKICGFEFQDLPEQWSERIRAYVANMMSRQPFTRQQDRTTAIASPQAALKVAKN